MRLSGWFPCWSCPGSLASALSLTSFPDLSFLPSLICSRKHLCPGPLSFQSQRLPGTPSLIKREGGWHGALAAGAKGLSSWPGATLLANQAPILGPSNPTCKRRLFSILCICRGACHNCLKHVQVFSFPLAWSRCSHPGSGLAQWNVGPNST